MARADFVLLTCLMVAAPALAAAADPPTSPASSFPSAVPVIEPAPPASDSELPPGRQRPGRQPTYPSGVTQTNPGAVNAPAPDAFSAEDLPVPDRWRLAATLGLVKPRSIDPYNQNTLKGDRPLKGTTDWFLVLNGISDTVVQPSSFPEPISSQSTQRP